MGNNSTSIRNGMSDAIWVKCDTDRASVEMLKFEPGANESAVYIGNVVGLRGEQGNNIRSEFASITPQDVKEFTFSVKDKSTIYITIVASNGEIIANAMPIPQGIFLVIKEREKTNSVDSPNNYIYRHMPPISEPQAAWTGKPAALQESGRRKNWILKKREVLEWVFRSAEPDGGYWVRWIWTPELK